MSKPSLVIFMRRGRFLRLVTRYVVEWQEGDTAFVGVDVFKPALCYWQLDKYSTSPIEVSQAVYGEDNVVVASNGGRWLRIPKYSKLPSDNIRLTTTLTVLPCIS